MQTKSENHETSRGVMISHVEAMIKIWEGFAHGVTYDAYKPRHLCTCDINITRDLMTHVCVCMHPTWRRPGNLLKILSQPLHVILWHHDKFHDFRPLFAFYIIWKQLIRKFMVMFREYDVREFGYIHEYGLKLYSKTCISIFIY